MKHSISTNEAAQAIGVSESSVKRWCDLGILASAKTPGGHRRMPVRDVIRFVRQEERTVAKAELLGLPRQSGRRRYTPETAYHDLLRGLRTGDESRIRLITFDLFLGGYEISTICDQALVPALAAIGELWHIGKIEVFEEHRSIEICTRLLHDFHCLLPVPATTSPLAIGASLEGDPYTLPGRMAELVLLEAGWRVASLGQALPIAGLIPAVERLEPALFWMTLSTIADQLSFLENYRLFAEALKQRGVPLIVGGRALTPELRRQMQFSSCGDSLTHLRSLADTFRVMLECSR